MVALVLERRAQAAERRAADERAADGREAAPRGLPGAVGIDELRAGDAAAGMRLHELAEDGDRARLGHGIGVGDEHELAGRRTRARVDVRRVARRPCVLDHTRAERIRRRGARRVRDHDHLVHLRHERRQRLGELLAVAVGDDDGGDLHAAEHLQIDGDGAARGLLPREQLARARAPPRRAGRARQAPAARRPPAARARRRPPPHRRPRAAQHPARRRPASRRPSPRARAGRSPRSGTA